MMTIKLRYLLLVLALVPASLLLNAASGTNGFSPTTASAQTIPTRIAVIDRNKLIAETTVGKAGIAKFRALQADLEKKGTELGSELTQLYAQQNTLPEAKFAELQMQFVRKQQAFRDSARQDAVNAQSVMYNELNKKIMPVISVIGNEMGMAAIFTREESGLLFASDSIDITNVTIARVNAAFPEPAE